MSETTKLKFGKLFQDMVRLETELELYRKQKLTVLAKDVFNAIDTDKKGFCTLQNYLAYFKKSFSQEGVTFLFKRHDR